MENLQGRILWKAFIEGNDQSFESLYELYIARLFAFGMKYHTDRDLIQDCLQDLFVNIYHYRSNLNPDVNPLSYLFAALRNGILARLKQEKKNLDTTALIYTFQLEWSAEMTWIKKEEDRALIYKLQQFTQRLPARQREILYLKFSEELGYEAIAEMLNITVPTCRTLVYRAIKQLREQIENLPLVHLLCLFFKRHSL
ncbi:sigma-70 family RNA polymerase sigma factor [Olivibacter ginsenosidimutans]|uniref:Sigma-70 family RNA polymerase sigma factor n=1 Tax=Olivibacter ginsenosidimutans TaxID=1176537 RepID=A0ABP9CAS0_9SPHI